MSLSHQGSELSRRFLEVFLNTAISLQPGDDPEVTLEALVEASRLLTEHLEKELQEIRVEQAD